MQQKVRDKKIKAALEAAYKKKYPETEHFRGSEIIALAKLIPKRE